MSPRILAVFSSPHPHQEFSDHLLLAKDEKLWSLPSLCLGRCHLLFGRDVAVHQRAALHAGHLDMGGDIPELQAEVLSSDGDLGAPFPGARHWDYLEGGSMVIWQAPRESRHPLADEARKSWRLVLSAPDSMSWVQAHPDTQVWDCQRTGASGRTVKFVRGFRSSVERPSFIFPFHRRENGT